MSNLNDINLNGITPVFSDSIVNLNNKKQVNKKYNPDHLETKLKSLGYSVKNTNTQNKPIISSEPKPVNFTTNNSIKNLENKSMAPHNNMVPFFGGSAKQNIKPDRRDNLEDFTGQKKLDQLHKHEVPTLFSPAPENIYGITSPRQLDRYTTSLNVRNNELPFEQKRVGKGLSEGYTDKPSGGFHNPIRILPKTIDELLVNPKETYDGRIIKGKHMTGKRTAEPNSYNYSQKVLVDNENGQRNFVTTGQEIKPMCHSEIVLNDVKRVSTAPNLGPAKSQIKQDVQDDKNISTRKVKKSILGTLLGAVQVTGKKTYNLLLGLRETNRNTTGITREFGNATNTSGPSQQTHNADNINEQKNTNRITYDEGVIQGVGGIQQINNSKYVMPIDEAPTTSRELIENKTNNGYINTENFSGKSYDPNQLTKTTKNQLIEDNNLNKNISSVHFNGKSYDPYQLTKTTGKETLENFSNNTNINGLNPANKLVNPYDIPLPTIKQYTENSIRNGNLSNNIKNNNVPTDQTKTTGRQTIEYRTQNKNISNNVLTSKTSTFNTDNLLDSTKQQQYENNNYNGQTNINIGSVVYDPLELLKNTQRENLTDSKGIAYNNIGQITYDPYESMKSTARETYTNQDHLGGAGYEHGQRIYDNAYDMEMKEPIDGTMRDPNQEGPRLTLGTSRIIMTSNKKNNEVTTSRSLVPQGTTNKRMNFRVKFNDNLTTEKNINYNDNVINDIKTNQILNNPLQNKLCLYP